MPSCGEPQAGAGTCPLASEVGGVAAQAGLGPDPSDLYGGIYLTGPYGESTQGLSIVLPVDPGPFDLGLAVIRAGIQINPATGQLSITSGRLPSIVDGVPLQLKTLLLQLDRGQFNINPSCESLNIAGMITSIEGSSVSASAEPFGASSPSCPSPQDSPSIATAKAKSVSPNTARVSLITTRIPASSRGLVKIELSCIGAGSCRGKLVLLRRVTSRRKGGQSKATIIGSSGFSIPASATTTVKLALNVRGRALLRADHGQLNAALTILKSSPRPSHTYNESVRLVRESR